MDGPDSAPVATFYAPGAWGARVELGDGAAHHATVKRLAVGDAVRLTSGDGRRVHGRIEVLRKGKLEIELMQASLESVDELAHVELWAPVGDRDRMLMLAEKGVELGVSAWRSVIYRRSRSVMPRGEGDAFGEKLRLRMISALEQSGGAWLPELLPEAEAEVIVPCAAPNGAILLDALGQPLVDLMPTMHAPVTLALGPEGGLHPEERASFITNGWRAASLGDSVLRFETAGIAGLALTRSLLRSP